MLIGEERSEAEGSRKVKVKEQERDDQVSNPVAGAKVIHAQQTSMMIQTPDASVRVKEHVMKQAQGLKKKSLNWRERRHIPPDCDASSVRLKVFPSTCPSCDWEAKSAAKRIMGVKVCKRCGSRAMSPVLLSANMTKYPSATASHTPWHLAG